MTEQRKRSFDEIASESQHVSGSPGKRARPDGVSEPEVTKPDDMDDSMILNLEAETNLARAQSEWQTVKRKKKGKEKNGKQTTDAIFSPTPDDKATDEASIKFNLKYTSPISVQDLQNLVFYVLADGVAPTWLALQNAKRIKKVVFVTVPGLDKSMLFDADGQWKDIGNDASNGNHHNCENGSNATSQTQFEEITEASLVSGAQSLASALSHYLPVRCPGDTRFSKVHSPIQAMLIAPTPVNSEGKKVKSSRSAPDEKAPGVKNPITRLLHTTEELQDAEYPLHPALLPDPEDLASELSRRMQMQVTQETDWVNTNVTSLDAIQSNDTTITQRSDLSLGLPIYSLDCEMVPTTDKVYSLARVTLLDWSGRTALDKYVLPKLPVSDYFTQYSGITPAHLCAATSTLSEIQTELLTLLTPITILLGHSLDSDLKALKLTHPHVIDTSMIYPHPRGLPLRSSLKYLAQKYLHRDIQNHTDGHNSIEDARAVLDLVKLKCEKGVKWGTSEAQGEPIWRRLARSGKRGAIVDYGTPEWGLGKEADLKIACKDDGEVVEGILRAVRGDGNGVTDAEGVEKDDGVDFVWARVRELEFARGWAKAPLVKPLRNGGGDGGGGSVGIAEVQDAPAPQTSLTGTNGGGTDGHTQNGTNPRIPPQLPAETQMNLATANADDTLHTTSTAANPSATSFTDPDLRSPITSTLTHLTHLSSSLHSLPQCPSHSTLLILHSPHGTSPTTGPKSLQQLQSRSDRYKRALKVSKWNEKILDEDGVTELKWGKEEERELKRECERVRRGWGCVGVL